MSLGSGGYEVVELEPEPRALGVLLSLGDLNEGPPCHGYSVGCELPCCRSRSESVSPDFLRWLEDESWFPMPRYLKPAPKPQQPWQVAA